MAISINYDMDQGADFSFLVYVAGADGLPVDVSQGFSANSQMRRFYTSTQYYTLNTSTSLEDVEIGYILVYLSASETAAIKAGNYVYDVELASDDGQSTLRLQQGTITVYPEVTRV